jgi:hypothetical protein
MSLNISGNHIVPALQEDFLKLLKSNKTLLSLNAGDNELSDTGTVLVLVSVFVIDFSFGFGFGFFFLLYFFY